MTPLSPVPPLLRRALWHPRFCRRRRLYNNLRLLRSPLPPRPRRRGHRLLNNLRLLRGQLSLPRRRRRLLRRLLLRRLLRNDLLPLRENLNPCLIPRLALRFVVRLPRLMRYTRTKS